MNEEILTLAVRDLCLEAAPERRVELEELWQKYAPQIAHKADREGFEIGNAWGTGKPLKSNVGTTESNFG